MHRLFNYIIAYNIKNAYEIIIIMHLKETKRKNKKANRILAKNERVKNLPLALSALE